MNALTSVKQKRKDSIYVLDVASHEESIQLLPLPARFFSGEKHRSCSVVLHKDDYVRIPS